MENGKLLVGFTKIKYINIQCEDFIPLCCKYTYMLFCTLLKRLIILDFKELRLANKKITCDLFPDIKYLVFKFE